MKMQILRLIASVIVSVTGWGGPANCETSPHNRWLFARGINLSSGAFNPERNPGVYGQDYVYPSSQDLSYYASKGFAVLRLPYRWERLQPSLFGALDDAELGRISGVVAAAQEHGMRVILSPHNYGRYFIDGKEALIGTARLPFAAFADFSRKIAAAFAGNNAVYALSLMNEPHDTHGLWMPAAQAAFQAIRYVDHDRLVLIPGDGWSSAWNWWQTNRDLLIDDPAGHIMYEAHQYFDQDHSGAYKSGYSPIC
jgi:endoglucanase